MIRIKRKKTNPADHELLKKIRIEKEIYQKWKFINYNVYFNNNKIASISFDLDTNTVFDARVDSEFRRKGIATYVYDFIEKDFNTKLKPDKTQLDDGVAFWKNRLRKQNPTDKQFLSKIKIKKEKLGIVLLYKAYYNDNVIATIDYVPYDNSISSIWIETPYRRKGLASFMYNYIEKDQEITLIPSSNLLPDGRRFWENRLKGKPEKMGLLYR